MPEAALSAASAFTAGTVKQQKRKNKRHRSPALAIIMDLPRQLRGSGRIGRRLVPAGASIAVLMALSAGSATAQVAWTGAANTDWTNNANWSGGAVPASPTAVTINSSNPAVLGVGGAASGSTGNLFVGDTTSGSLTVQNGSSLTSLGSFRIGGGTGTGTVTVTGAGSQWTASGLALSVGGSGTGILNILNGGKVTASGGISLGNAGGAGTLNVSNATIVSQSLNVGAASQVNFDNATYRATRSSGVWIGAGTGTLNIAAGGLTLDSVGFTVSALRGLGGAGALTKTGTGIVNLTTSNTYTGRTVIDQGTLALRTNGSIAASSGVTANGTFDISAITPSGADIQSLSGTGSVTLGAKTLNLTNANDTFAGAISGTGDVTILGGAETFTGVSTYGGQTNVRGTSSLRLLDGGQITGTSVTTLDGAGVTAQVSGAGSLLQTGALTFANGAGSNVTLDILDGGVVRTTGAGITAIGSSATATATVNVDGAASRFEVADGLGIGNVSAGTTAFLNVTNGGTVQSASGAVGSAFRSTATRAVTVSGAGSNWTMSGALNLRSGASLSVLDGGAVTAATSTVGSGIASTANLLVSGPGSIYSVTGDQLVGTGNGTGIVTLADSGRASIGGLLTLGSGAGATGVLNIGGGEGQAATSAGTLDAATLTFGPGTGRLNFNHTGTGYVFSTVMSGAGAIHQVAGFTNLTGDSSAFAGTTSVEGGTLAVNGVLGGTMDVLSGGRLQGIGIVGDTTNAGIIAPGNSIGTLTVAGNYTGTGGTLQIESVLGGDASPSDRLVVTGNTAGSTNVRVINVGGAGAQTVEGIKIVDVGGASNGTFRLQGDYALHGEQAVVAGAYAYTLQKNGVATPADGDWYLRSALASPPPAAPAGPLYQPGVPIYESYGRVLLGMNGLPTLRQRVGNGPAAGGDEAAGGSAPVWLRVEGQHARRDPSTTSGSRFSSDQMTMQGGADAVVYKNGSGQLIAGVSARYASLSADVKSYYGDGKIKVDGLGIGGALTWYGDNGFYVDGQSQMTWYRADLSSDPAGSLTDGNRGFGYAFGAESGRRIPLGGALSLTPQAQLVYSSVSFNAFDDRFGAAVSGDDADSLQGRAGLSLDHRRDSRDAQGRAVQSDIYAITNLYYEFLDGTAVDVGGTRFTSAEDRLWGGIGAGGAYRWAGGHYALYGEVSYNTSLADLGDSDAYKGTLGFRATW